MGLVRTLWLTALIIISLSCGKDAADRNNAKFDVADLDGKHMPMGQDAMNSMSSKLGSDEPKSGLNVDGDATMTIGGISLSLSGSLIKVIAENYCQAPNTLPDLQKLQLILRIPQVKAFLSNANVWVKDGDSLVIFDVQTGKIQAGNAAPVLCLLGSLSGGGDGGGGHTSNGQVINLECCAAGILSYRSQLGGVQSTIHLSNTVCGCYSFPSGTSDGQRAPMKAAAFQAAKAICERNAGYRSSSGGMSSLTICNDYSQPTSCKTAAIDLTTKSSPAISGCTMANRWWDGL